MKSSQLYFHEEEARGYFNALKDGESLSAWELACIMECTKDYANLLIISLMSSRDIMHFIDEEGIVQADRFEARPGYKGWDFSEFTKRVGLPDPDDHWKDLITPYSAHVYDLFSDFWVSDPTEEDRAIIKEMRDFLTACVSSSYGTDYHAPMLAGILAIEDDGEFVKAFAHNLGFMWN